MPMGQSILLSFVCFLCLIENMHCHMRMQLREESDQVVSPVDMQRDERKESEGHGSHESNK